MFRTVFVLLVTAAVTLSPAAARTVLPFNDGWRFSKGDAPEAANESFDDSAWQSVHLPHTWNAEDGVPGKTMYQGIGWYRKRFDVPASWRGRLLFIRFGAASLSSTTYLNGLKLGQHDGGFAAFCYEITPDVHFGGANEIAVQVDNRRGRVSPLAGDFTIFGGLYRPAALIVTPAPVAITPIDFAGPGVYLKQVAAGPDKATVELTTKLVNRRQAPSTVTVAAELLDQSGKRVLRSTQTRSVEPGDAVPVVQSFSFAHPHLWNGVADPYLYRARVTLMEGGQTVDEVEQALGLRTIGEDPQRGFLLNGQPMQIHGVCMHQDGGPMAWAVTPKDERADMAIIREMGVNGLRLAHYQHSETFHDLCDRNGILVWSELALVNNLHGDHEFIDNLRQQLTELIRQNYNHPSIVIWSMYNEIGSNNKTAPGPVVKMLSDLAHAEDPTRMTSGAASGDTMANLPDVMTAVDLVSLNFYPGWYGGVPSDLGPQIDRYNTRYGDKGVGVSEYGGGASVKQHEQGLTKHPNPSGRWHPEEWQATLHEICYPQIKARPYVWGSFLWAMFDFPSSGRHEGDADGINDKGLVTRDRKVKKDAYFFYKANWNPEPMVYITSRRDTHRSAPTTQVKLYSNCASVSLKVNGQAMPLTPAAAPHTFVAENVTLREGDNLIEADGTAGGKTVHDSCRWSYSSKGQ